MWTVFCTLEEGYAPKISVKKGLYKGFVQSLEFLKKVWKMEIKSGKVVKSLGIFFLSSYLKCFIEEIYY